MPAQTTQDWLRRFLACPVDGLPLTEEGPSLGCSGGHFFPVVDGIPVLLTGHRDPTHPYCSATLERVKEAEASTPAAPDISRFGAVDPFVQDEIVRTNGNLYRHLRGRLTRYPIPELRLPSGEGRTLLDVGCNWGRWTFAAARSGYRAVGLDPWIEAARAGKRVAHELGHDVGFVVGDARHLPFLEGSFDVSFSYSVLQHFEKMEAREAMAEMARVTARGGTVLVQMPNLFGIRQAFNFLRQSARRDRNPFRVRYWRPRELQETFDRVVGPSRLSVDGFFSLNAQASDLDLLPRRYAWVVRASEALRAASKVLPPLRSIADSLYVESFNSLAFRTPRPP